MPRPSPLLPTSWSWPILPSTPPPNLAQVLNDHDHIKGSTDIPMFYGCPDKDTIATHLLIETTNDASTIAAWDEAHKILLGASLCKKTMETGQSGTT